MSDTPSQNLPLETKQVALIGRPNVGKTSLFNQLTGLNLKTANYGGVTVEHAHGQLKFSDDFQCTLLDLPGTLSLYPQSPDESLVPAALLHHSLGPIDLVVNVVDGTRWTEQLYLTLSLVELGYPCLLVINQCDLMENQGQNLDLEALQNLLQRCIANGHLSISNSINSLSCWGQYYTT